MAFSVLPYGAFGDLVIGCSDGRQVGEKKSPYEVTS